MAASAQIAINIPNANRPGAGDVKVDGNDETKDIACQGGENVFVRGNHDVVTLTGVCGNVHVTGNDNTVTVDRAARLVSEGNDNIIGYRYPNMGVSTTGSGNKVHVVK